MRLTEGGDTRSSTTHLQHYHHYTYAHARTHTYTYVHTHTHTHTDRTLTRSLAGGKFDLDSLSSFHKAPRPHHISTTYIIVTVYISDTFQSHCKQLYTHRDRGREERASTYPPLLFPQARLVEAVGAELAAAWGRGRRNEGGRERRRGRRGMGETVHTHTHTHTQPARHPLSVSSLLCCPLVDDAKPRPIRTYTYTLRTLTAKLSFS